jgi:hypothetical protein
MSLTGEAIQILADKGLSAHEIAAVARANEAEKPRSAAAERQARYRAKKAFGVTSDVTSDVTPPPKDNIKPPASEANASGGGAADPVKALFDVGVALLVETGSTEKQARSLIGKWRKGRKDGEVLTALLDCRNRAISNPIEWLEKRFVGGRYVSASGYEYRGDIEAVIREAERRNDMATYWKAKGDLKREQRTAA